MSCMASQRLSTRRIPYLGPWLASVVEQKVGDRLVAQLKVTIGTTLLSAALICVIAGVGLWVDDATTKTWIARLINIIYAVVIAQGTIGAISGIRAGLTEFHGHWAVRWTGATLTGAVQAVLIPLIGLAIVWFVLSLTRFAVVDSQGADFRGWLTSLF